MPSKCLPNCLSSLAFKQLQVGKLAGLFLLQLRVWSVSQFFFKVLPHVSEGVLPHYIECKILVHCIVYLCTTATVCKGLSWAKMFSHSAKPFPPYCWWCATLRSGRKAAFHALKGLLNLELINQLLLLIVINKINIFFLCLLTWDRKGKERRREQVLAGFLDFPSPFTPIIPFSLPSLEDESGCALSEVNLHYEFCNFQITNGSVILLSL